MNDLPDMNRVKDLLMNWRYWALDCPLDPAEVAYYTVSPMFRDILPRGSVPPYDTEAAMLTEEVLKMLHTPYFPEWWLLLAYYGKGMTQDEIAQRLGIAQQSVSRHRLPAARRIFAEQWAGLIRMDEAA